jgi:hypothetical protein
MNWGNPRGWPLHLVLGHPSDHRGALRTRFLAKISEEEGRSTMAGKRGRGRTRDAEKMPTLLWADRQGTWTSTSTNNRGWSPC